MARDNDDVVAAALRLPPEGRAALAAALIGSLEDEEPEEDVEAAWSDEIRRRLDEVDAGAVKPIPWSEARGRILAAARGRGEAG
ncbi:addiction module protein [Polyangium sp. y55x31]|uniref:addiction module protein n=1 Tax=Polyangium sp. y55x31 TaxID=3042688 RepID=UPI0024827F0D|nr:addiction module protein [Polyangium sp. y55x31]MDI1477974.1 addiction module protein [Polyangium sp. y55x31]